MISAVDALGETGLVDELPDHHEAHPTEWRQSAQLQINAGDREAVEPFERTGAENPYEIQKDLQELMQDNVGIVRNEAEMRAALEQLTTLWDRARRAGVTGHREFNPGWHTALDLKNLLTVSEAITRAALERKESRGAQFREDYPQQEEQLSKINTMISKGEEGHMNVRWDPLPEMPDYLKQVIEENK